MNFTAYLKKYEGFISRDQFENLLNTLPCKGSKIVRSYYEEKYRYFLKKHPENNFKQVKFEQLRFEIK